MQFHSICRTHVLEDSEHCKTTVPLFVSKARIVKGSGLTQADPSRKGLKQPGECVSASSVQTHLTGKVVCCIFCAQNLLHSQQAAAIKIFIPILKF